MQFVRLKRREFTMLLGRAANGHRIDSARRCHAEWGEMAWADCAADD
jgi:hypothetical protein